ncbi:hypothetical protein HELRODRAFT_190394 [Helobdella robusta]|uniref:Bridge-like lipid transfer protein family member 1 C-terminal domain-containing protein n=1 Tax=Helobdella robusta TaxID=6412 RepID=T1FRY6_HELRO|nr:hypothetical protein HELRODRAFT_190394 [Helobdella robusta]ESO10149.1 hypothetical protein HELRODRAFT_190394 [Helobdella robusta]
MKPGDVVDTPYTATFSQQETTPNFFHTFPHRSHSLAASALPPSADPAYFQHSTANNTPVERVLLNKPTKKSAFTLMEVHFKGLLKGLVVGASLLPSLKAQYQVNTSSNVPTSASIAMPPIHIEAEYRQDSSDSSNPTDCPTNPLVDGLELREGSYLKATAEVGAFEHVLTTDLLNHLVFVQKVFMKSIQITATTPTNNAVRFETGKIDFELSNRVQRSRKEGSQSKPHEFKLPMENRIPKVFFQVKVDLNLALGTLIKNLMFEEAEAEFPHLASFGTSITLRNALQDEMISGASLNQEALLITLKRPIVFVLPSAFDKAILVWLNYRNAYEYWTEQRMALNKEIQQATQQVLTKLPPLALSESSLGVLFLQMTIDDLGICLPINPFTQKGFAVTREDSGLSGALVLTLESTQISACSYGSFVSKGKFTDFCLRFAEDFEVSWDDWKPEKASHECIMNALVVPNGTFEMCSRTTNSRQTTVSTQPQQKQQQPRYQPQQESPTKHQTPSSTHKSKTMPSENTEQMQQKCETTNAKWILNILWQMKGIDIHLDTNIGKRLNVVWNTLTSLAGEAQIHDAIINSRQNISIKVEQPSRQTSIFSSEDLPDFVYDLSLDPKTRTRLIEKEMNEQAKVVQDLKSLRASQNTIQEEERKLQGLEAALFHDFRQDIIKKFRSHHNPRKTYGASKLSVHSLDNRHVLKTSSLAPTKHQQADYEALSVPVTTPQQPQQQADQPEKELDVAPRHTNSSTGHYRTQSFDVSQLHSLGVRGANAAQIADKPDSLLFKHFPKLDFQKSAGRDLVAFEEETSPVVDNRSLLQEYGQQTKLQSDALPTFDIHSDEDEDEYEYYDDLASLNNPSDKTDAKLKNVMSKHNLQQQIVEPAVDFELDIRAEIDSGKCVLHPKEIKTEQLQTDYESAKRPATVWKVSPKSVDRRTRKRAKEGVTFTGVDILPSQINRLTMAQNNNTVFIIPGVDVKLHYNSRTVAASDDPLRNHSENTKKYLGFKRANLYIWCSIQKLPEEMLISTSLLDFLEQAIEPIPIEPLKRTAFKLNTPDTDFLIDTGSASSSALSKTQQPYASFPVEVVVYVRIQPSMVRFTCLPLSRVECLLRIPSLDIVFSTKKIEHSHSCDVDLLKEGMSKQSVTMLDNAEGVGGLSVSVCMNDFSLYIFHPYGGRQRRTSFTVSNGMESTAKSSSTGVSKSTLIHESRKDSLNLNVEFVKVNISRGRKIVQKDASTNANVVRFSLVCDIGSASFKYDMRRLLEILALPKAWYRRSLARRLFLGEEMAVYDSESDSDDASHFSSETSIVGSAIDANPDNTFSSGSTVPENSAKMAISKGTAVSSKNFTKGHKSFSQHKHPSQIQINKSLHYIPLQHSATNNMSQPLKTLNSWETLVLFSVNLPQLDVMVNMSNAMGNTVWTTKGLQCRGRLMIDSAGFKNVNMFAGLNSSKLEAKGGIIGGLIELQNVSGQALVKEVPDKEPKHRINTSLHILEMRLDYMGSTILITRISDLMVQLYDEWKLRGLPNINTKDFDVFDDQSILVFVHGKLSWDKLHMMISKSTTPDLLKMAHKLEEFFSQQLVSSKRVLSTFGTSVSTAKANKKNLAKEDEMPWLSEIKYHRHWQKVFQHLSCCKLANFSKMLPELGSMLGGSMNLLGKNITLACFHGINFRLVNF